MKRIAISKENRPDAMKSKHLLSLALTVLCLGATATLRAATAAVHRFIPEYTDARTCLQCHENVADEIMHTVHWRWEHTDPITGKRLGKNNVINNYCIAIRSNEPRCTSCHIGWGYSNASFDFNNANAIDCLACHDTTGTYKKFPTGSGYPVIGAPKEFPAGSGNFWQPPDLTYIARNVGKTSRATCGACHFYGGGGDAVKHGDLDSTLTNPSRDLDVHMGTNGLNFACATCHLPENAPRHEMLGSPYTQSTNAIPLACENCHGDAPHASDSNPTLAARLNTHVARVACQTCHIPAFARGQPTKMHWDWSTAGIKNTNGALMTVKGPDGTVIYDTQKGSFVWQKNVMPEYRWFNGVVDFITADDPVSSNEVVRINTLQGHRLDPKARIYPVKHFTGVQPYDAGFNRLAVPHLFPSGPTDTNAFWKVFDWNKAVAAGQAAVGRTFSGVLGFVHTEMYWVQNHMVAPKEQALQCGDCHAPRGRFDFAALGYPEDMAFRLQNMAGFKFTASHPGARRDQITLRFQTGPGYVYQVQSSTDLVRWNDVPGGRFTGGAMISEVGWTNATPSDMQAFYRVVRMPQ